MTAWMGREVWWLEAPFGSATTKVITETGMSIELGPGSTYLMTATSMTPMRAYWSIENCAGLEPNTDIDWLAGWVGANLKL